MVHPLESDSSPMEPRASRWAVRSSCSPNPKMIEELDEKDFPGFGCLTPSFPARHRQPRVRDLLPVNNKIGAAIFLVDGKLVREGKRIPVTSLDDLFRLGSAEGSVEALQELRRRTPLIEGNAMIPPGLTRLLNVRSSGSSIFIHCKDSGKTYHWRATLGYLAGDLISPLSHQEGIFFAGVPNEWVLVLRDDDAFRFLVAARELLTEAEADCREHLRVVPDDMELWP